MRARLGGTNTERTATSTIGRESRVDTVDTVNRGVDGAGKTDTVTVANKTDTKGGLGVLVRAGVLKVHGVPANLDIGVSSSIGVGTGDVRGPVTNRLGAGTPNTGLKSRNTRSVNVVMGSGADPVRRIRDGDNFSVAFRNFGRNQHGLVSGQNSLAESNTTIAAVHDRGRASTVGTVVLFGERLLNVAVLVTVKTTVLGNRVSVRGGFGVPLQTDLASRASVGAVHARSTRLVGRHGPAGVLLIWRH